MTGAVTTVDTGLIGDAGGDRSGTVALNVTASAMANGIVTRLALGTPDPAAFEANATCVADLAGQRFLSQTRPASFHSATTGQAAPLPCSSPR